jgi:hypothetical protein
MTPLPDLKPANAAVLLTPAQQKQAIADLARKKTEQEAQAMKDIQATR